MRILEFERNLLDSLKRLVNFSSVKRLGIGLSGGADSVSLLCALAAARDGALKDSKGFFPQIICVTVDHSIRPQEESSGDAEYALSLCDRLGVERVLKKIPRGAAEKAAAERKKGLEEAARFLRYQKFEEFAREKEIDYICLAHNQNDALETLLMRFLQGSSASCGMAAQRGIYLRPLLETSRGQIEEYLRQKKIDWRTDSSNFENNYFRNKIRNVLVPFLDKNFDGWKKALLSGAEKAAIESDAMESFFVSKIGGLESELQKMAKGGQVEFSKALFESLPVALRQRLVYKAADLLAGGERIPYSFVRELCFWPEKDFKKISAGGLEAVSKKEKVFLKILQKEATESGFFDIMAGGEKSGEAVLERTLAPGDKTERKALLV